MLLWCTMPRSARDFFTFHPPTHTIDLVSVWIWSISVNNMAFWNSPEIQIDMSRCLVLQGYVEKNISTFTTSAGSKTLHPSMVSKTWAVHSAFLKVLKWNVSIPVFKTARRCMTYQTELYDDDTKRHINTKSNKQLSENVYIRFLLKYNCETLNNRTSNIPSITKQQKYSGTCTYNKQF
jgi:hypothetical protein